MRYLGSKAKLLNTIEVVIEKYNIEGYTFGDLFAGTSCVGDYFKDRYKIQSNDFLYFSYVISKAKLNNSRIPSFTKFTNEYKSNIFCADVYLFLNFESLISAEDPAKMRRLAFQ